MHFRLSGWFTLSERLAPVNAFCGVSEVVFSRANRLAVGRDQLGIREVVLLGVSVFNVTNRARQTLNKGGDTVVAFTAQAGWPVNGRAGADFRFPLFIHFGQVAGEDEGGTGTIGAAPRRCSATAASGPG